MYDSLPDLWQSGATVGSHCMGVTVGVTGCVPFLRTVQTGNLNPVKKHDCLE